MVGTSRPTRIGLDCRALRPPAADGVSAYILGLVAALAEHATDAEIVCFCFPDGAALLPPAIRERLRVVTLTGRRLPFLSPHVRDAQAITRSGIDVLCVPGGMPPLFFREPAVLVVHDLLILDHPEWFPSQPLSRWILTPLAIQQARHIIAVSDATRQDAIRHFPYVANHISVIPPGISKRTDRRESGEQHLLVLGTLEPRKNILLAIDAYLSVRETSPDFPPLLIVGRRGWKDGVILSRIVEAASQAPDAVRYLGPVPPDVRNKILDQSLALLFPSLGEGFGLPPLEAQAVGVPCVVSDIPILRETLGDGALFADPHDVRAWVEAIRRVSQDATLRAELIARGKNNAVRFSWERTAGEVLRVCREAAA